MNCGTIPYAEDESDEVFITENAWKKAALLVRCRSLRA